MICSELNRLSLAVTKEGSFEVALYEKVSVADKTEYYKKNHVSLAGKENRPETVHRRPLRLQPVNGLWPIKRDQLYYRASAIHYPSVGPIIYDQLIGLRICWFFSMVELFLTEYE